MVTETRTLTLSEFLLARIAEDEAWAQAGHNGNTHARRFSPARVLAECEAKRRIVALHGPTEPYCDLNFSNANHGYFEGPCMNLCLLAPPYADHADFREEWRP